MALDKEEVTTVVPGGCRPPAWRCRFEKSVSQLVAPGYGLAWAHQGQRWWPPNLVVFNVSQAMGLEERDQAILGLAGKPRSSEPSAKGCPKMIPACRMSSRAAAAEVDACGRPEPRHGELLGPGFLKEPEEAERPSARRTISCASAAQMAALNSPASGSDAHRTHRFNRSPLSTLAVLS